MLGLQKWKWWEEEPLPDGVKWKFLEHNGVFFPPEYKPLPKRIKMKYDGEPLALPPEVEEVAYFFAAMANTDYYQKPVFRANFFEDWRSLMNAELKAKIKDLEKCDFAPITAHVEEEREQRKNRSKEEKDKEKAANAAIQEKYGIAKIDG